MGGVCLFAIRRLRAPNAPRRHALLKRRPEATRGRVGGIFAPGALAQARDCRETLGRFRTRGREFAIALLSEPYSITNPPIAALLPREGRGCVYLSHEISSPVGGECGYSNEPFFGERARR